MDISEKQKEDLKIIELSAMKSNTGEKLSDLEESKYQTAIQDLGFNYVDSYHKSDSPEFEDAYKKDLTNLIELSHTNPEEAAKIRKSLSYFLPSGEKLADPEYELYRVQSEMHRAKAETFAQAFAINAGEIDQQRPEFQTFF